MAKYWTTSGGSIVSGTEKHAVGSAIELYNTADVATNYEKLRLSWESNVATIRMLKGGTGTSRQLDILTHDGSGLRFSDNGRVSTIGAAGSQWGLSPGTDGIGMFFNGRNTSGTSVPSVQLGNDTFGSSFSASSGTQKLVEITGALNQTSTAAFTALNVTITGTGGSGAQKLISLNRSGSEVFAVHDSGQVRVSAKIKPVSAGGAVQIEADHTTHTNEAISLLNVGSLTASSGTQLFSRFSSDIGQSGTAGYKILRVFAGEVSNGSGEKAILAVDVNSETKFAVMSGSGSGAHTAGVGGNIGLNTTAQFGGGKGVFGVANATTVPSSNPSGGGVLYCEAGALKYRGSSGTVTTLGVA